MALLPVADAKALVLADVVPLAIERVPLAAADRRVLAENLTAARDQPPFAASAMDGYAVRAADAAEPGSRLEVIGTSAAGHGFAGTLAPGSAVRIFTGAPVPGGADSIVIQEDTERDGEAVIVKVPPRVGQSIRRRGLDFAAGDVVLAAGTLLGPRHIGLAAAMNQPLVPVWRRPRVALFTTGDELVLPGGNPRADQIISSNSFALAALIARCGGEPVDLGIVADTLAATEAAIAQAAAADILVTTGGASVGDHDFVQEALKRQGVDIGFWKIAMRPGKPLMFGTRGAQRVLGLPGNPVSALVCAELFLKPLIRAMTGLPTGDDIVTATLASPLKANDSRQDYIRATLRDGHVTPFSVQDSSMQRALAQAQALIIRPPHAPAAAAGGSVEVLVLEE